MLQRFFKHRVAYGQINATPKGLAEVMLRTA
jgi:hypothetical protein